MHAQHGSPCKPNCSLPLPFGAQDQELPRVTWAPLAVGMHSPSPAGGSPSTPGRSVSVGCCAIYPWVLALMPHIGWQLDPAGCTLAHVIPCSAYHPTVLQVHCPPLRRA